MTVELYICNGEDAGNHVITSTAWIVENYAKRYKFRLTEWLTKSYKVYHLVLKTTERPKEMKSC